CAGTGTGDRASGRHRRSLVGRVSRVGRARLRPWLPLQAGGPLGGGRDHPSGPRVPGSYPTGLIPLVGDSDGEFSGAKSGTTVLFGRPTPGSGADRERAW